MRHSLFILLCLLLVQCIQEPETNHIQILDEIPEHIQEIKNLTVFPGDSEPKYSIELIPEQTFGKTGNPRLSSILKSIADDKKRVIIRDFNASDSHSDRLYVYNPDGTFLTKIGGSGNGPGEFEFLINVEEKAGKIFALDHTNRLNVYNSSDFSFERSTQIDQWEIRKHDTVKDMDFVGIATRTDGNHLALFSEKVSETGRSRFINLLMDTDGNALNFEPLEFMTSQKVIKRGSSIPISFMSLPFMGHTIVALSGESGLYLAWTQDFLIRKYDANGGYQSSIYYPVTGSPFDLSVYTDSALYHGADVMNTLEITDQDLPESNPILSRIKVDDENRIWAAVPMDPQQKMLEWWILNESGELFAKLIRPSDQRILDIKNGYLYAKEIDEETDAEYVAKYRIEFK